MEINKVVLKLLDEVLVAFGKTINRFLRMTQNFGLLGKLVS